MKIVICTTPIRNENTSYPPFGSMDLMQSLRLAGFDPYFYDIDGLRPSFDEVVQFFREQTPDIVGVSAVVSTAYAYTKELIAAIKEVSPDTKIVVGGNLAASAELLLRLCKVDVCGIGEGEEVIVGLVKYWEANKTTDDFGALQKIKGLAYLDEDGEMVFTGYAVAIQANQFRDPDWTILEQYSRIENFVIDPMTRNDFVQDIRSYEPHRRGKKAATVRTAKGCVARCTFCHRWDRGYRHWDVQRIVDNIRYLTDRYNVGFINFGDENFGSDRRKLNELLEAIKPLDILFTAGGVRVASVDLDLLKRMKDSGCVSLYYGMETGSARILDIMEKNANQQRNLDAALWTYEAGVYTIYQLVLAMPGEDHSTISETTEFIKKITEFLPDPPSKRVSLNYVQALPGTPVYEFARDTGRIGPTMLEEEQYLLNISDIDATTDTNIVNFTQFPYLTVQTWMQKIIFQAEAHWYKQHNWKQAPKIPEAARLNGHIPNIEGEEDYSQGGYFNLVRKLVKNRWFLRVISNPVLFPLKFLYPTIFIQIHDFKSLPKKRYLSLLLSFLAHQIGIRKRGAPQNSKSLRQVMKDRAQPPETKSQESMLPLRDGR